jgi:hypothetical protein
MFPLVDDLPPNETTPDYQALRRSLERAIGKLFYEACGGVLQGLLLTCEWYFSDQNLILTLYVHCPDHETSGRVLNNVNEISRVLRGITPYARIQVDSPLEGDVVLLEVELDQFSTS